MCYSWSTAGISLYCSRIRVLYPNSGTPYPNSEMYPNSELARTGIKPASGHFYTHIKNILIKDIDWPALDSKQNSVNIWCVYFTVYVNCSLIYLFINRFCVVSCLTMKNVIINLASKWYLLVGKITFTGGEFRRIFFFYLIYFQKSARVTQIYIYTYDMSVTNDDDWRMAHKVKHRMTCFQCGPGE